MKEFLEGFEKVFNFQVEIWNLETTHQFLKL